MSAITKLPFEPVRLSLDDDETVLYFANEDIALQFLDDYEEMLGYTSPERTLQDNYVVEDIHIHIDSQDAILEIIES